MIRFLSFIPVILLAAPAFAQTEPVPQNWRSPEGAESGANSAVTPIGSTPSGAPITNTSLEPQEARQGPVTRVTKGSGVLPNNHGQQWREYDITPYTSRVTTTSKPEQAIVDWILRETGTEVWFSEPLGILNANHDTLRVYHTPEMQQIVSGVVDRFVGSQAETYVIGMRMATISNPNWRSMAQQVLRPIDVQTPGIHAWLVSKENAALLVAEISKRIDYREHNALNLTLHNGQPQTVARMRPRNYVRSVRARQGVLGGHELEMGQVEEGYSVQISPLVSLDGVSIDAVIKCNVDQIEKLVPVSIDVPGQSQRVQIQIPQIVSWRLHERFRWPVDQVLVLGCGVVATPAPDGPKPLIPIPFAKDSSRADALLFVECKGRASQTLIDPKQAIAPSDQNSRGRY